MPHRRKHSLTAPLLAALVMAQLLAVWALGNSPAEAQAPCVPSDTRSCGLGQDPVIPIPQPNPGPPQDEPPNQESPHKTSHRKPDSTPDEGRSKHHREAKPNGCSGQFTKGSSWNFKGPCNNHDICYMQKGGPDVSYTVKESCDDTFKREMDQWCYKHESHPEKPHGCLDTAKRYREGVRLFGGPYFRDPIEANRAGPNSWDYRHN
jgi:hypothetical protein